MGSEVRRILDDPLSLSAPLTDSLADSLMHPFYSGATLWAYTVCGHDSVFKRQRKKWV